MTDDRRRATEPEALDDAAVEELVRAAAESWTMPAVRLDAPSWRDRVRSPRARRLAAAGDWLARIGQAAGAALALTVVAALVAVVITRPPAEPGTTPGTSGEPSPDATGDAHASPLPKLLLAGALPDPSELVVQTGAGDFAVVDLTSGSIGGPMTGSRSGSALQVRPNGDMVCLCVAESGSVDGGPTNAAVRLDRFDAAGRLLDSIPIASFAGEPDPRDAGQATIERPPHVLTATGFSPGSRYGFVGWSVRAHPAWRSGLIVVDLRDGGVVSRLDLPDASTGDADHRRVVEAPRVIGSTGSGEVIAARGWYEWWPPTSERPDFLVDSDVFRVGFAGGMLGDAAPVQLTGDCGSRVLHAGALPGGGTWLVCSRGSQTTVLRRIGVDGGVPPDVRIPGAAAIDGETTALSRDGQALFAWDPESATLTRVDLFSGETSRGEGASARAGGGPLAAVGRWLAPTAVAKTYLRGSVVVSPDGTRVYAIGITEGADERDVTASTGVFVFDAVTLENLSVWPPTADFVSLTVSLDGRFVYAAGLPGVDATGRRRPGQPASITVFDASDGAVRLVAGQLGDEMITFPFERID